MPKHKSETKNQSRQALLDRYSKASGAALAASKSTVARYSAGGAAALFALSPQADAALVITPVGNTITLPPGTGLVFSVLDIAGFGGTDDVIFRLFENNAYPFQTALYANPNMNFRMFGVTNAGFNYATRLGSGVNIPGTLTEVGAPGVSHVLAFTAAAYSGPNTMWGAGDVGYLPFRLIDGGDHFGWVHLEHSADRRSLTIVRYGIETDPGVGTVTPSLAAPVPEPGTLASLALGAAGLLAWRRKQRRKRESASNSGE